jgi:hypothetical protein
MARTRLYRDGELVREDFPVSEISDHIVEPNAFVWLDYCAPTGEELATIAQELNLHPVQPSQTIPPLRDHQQRPRRLRGITTIRSNHAKAGKQAREGNHPAKLRSLSLSES